MGMNRRFYIENPDGSVEASADVLAWEQWWAHADRRVAMDDLGEAGTVSTVFLGIDARLDGDGPPLLYETLALGGPLDGTTMHCATRAEARAAHKAMVSRIREMAHGGRRSTKGL